MFKAIILAPAKEDIRDATIWYNSKQKNLGRRFTLEIRQKVLLIQQNPEIFAVRYDDVRTVVLEMFPFMIHYTINDKQQSVIILAIFHTSLDPSKWRNRK